MCSRITSKGIQPKIVEFRVESIALWRGAHHGHGHLHQFRVRLDAAEVRQSVDRSDSACQPQPAIYIQAIFTPLRRDAGHTKWFIDEFDCVLPTRA